MAAPKNSDGDITRKKLPWNALFRTAGKLVRGFFCLYRWSRRGRALDDSMPEDRRRRELVRSWGRGITRIFGISVTVENLPETLPENALFVGNHVCYLDIFVHAALLGARFAAKAELAHAPLIGGLLRAAKPIWIDRARRADAGNAARRIAESLRGNSPVMIYPEGTTTAGTGELLPFRSTAFEAAMEAASPIVPILTVYAPIDGGFSVGWYGKQKLLPHFLRICALKEIKCHVYFSEAVFPKSGESRKELASRVRSILELRRKNPPSGGQLW